MGGNNFFSKIASVDPIAQALHLPGYNAYAKAQANAHLPGSNGPYSGIAPTLAGANAGYAPGGPGSNPMWRQPQPWHQGGLLGALQGGATQFGNVMDVGGNTPLLPTTNPQFKAPNLSNASPSQTGPVGQVNPYSAAAQKAGGGLYG
jgi:hypothetical protein